jgi:hypothetical protein
VDFGDQAERSARRVANSKPVRLAARAGLAANGLLHLLVAWLAVRVASGSVARADQAGALQAIAAEPFGRMLLWLLAAGFGGVVMWRLREALWGFPHAKKRTQKRLFGAGQVLVFGVLTVLAVRVATGSPAGSGGQGATAAVLRLPGGQVIVAATGVGVLITGAAMVQQGWQLAFIEDMDLRRAPAWVRASAQRCGQVGAVAKGLAVMIIGVLIVVAAVRYQPARAEGLDAALKTLAGQPLGAVALVAVALGLASFGVFCFFDARYHRV